MGLGKPSGGMCPRKQPLDLTNSHRLTLKPFFIELTSAGAERSDVNIPISTKASAREWLSGISNTNPKQGGLQARNDTSIEERFTVVNCLFSRTHETNDHDTTGGDSSMILMLVHPPGRLVLLQKAVFGGVLWYL